MPAQPVRPPEAIVQVLLGTATAPEPDPRPGRTAVQLEVNVDDVTGEVLARTIASLVAAGAHDAWAMPIVMKKGRPAPPCGLADPPTSDGWPPSCSPRPAASGMRAHHRRALAAATQSSSTSTATRCCVKRGGGRAKPNPATARPARRRLGIRWRDVLRVAETLATLAPARSRSFCPSRIGRIAPIPKDRA